MKNYLVPAVLTLMIFFLACNKDDNNPNGNEKLLDYYAATVNPDTFKLDYNSNGQNTRVEDKYSLATMDVTGNQLHSTYFDKLDNRTVIDATFSLNSNGDITSGTAGFSYNPSMPYTSQFTYTYDASGHMVSQTETESTGNTFNIQYEWTDGNLTTELVYLNGNLNQTKKFEYNTAVEDKLHLDDFRFFNTTNSFVGITGKNLPSRLSIIIAPATTNAYDYHYAYTTDADGYPVMVTLTQVNPPFNETYIYHYQ